MPPAFDALLPPQMAARAEEIGVRKAELAVLPTLTLGVLAGAFIAMGAIFATVVTVGAAGVLPWGVVRLLAGTVFSLGLILVVVGGAELFTGNTLIIMAWASGKLGHLHLLRNWALVYAGNFIGAVGTVALVFVAGHHMFDGGRVGAAALSIGAAKVQLGFLQAVALGTLANALVCMAVWLTFSARTTADRVLVIVPPIAAFVAAGFEHSIANMYFVPMALFIRAWAPDAFWAATGTVPADFAALTWGNFLLHNLLPVTIGNIIGGVVLVGLVYWSVYLRAAALRRRSRTGDAGTDS